jgi:hypothetical protein
MSLELAFELVLTLWVDSGPGSGSKSSGDQACRTGSPPSGSATTLSLLRCTPGLYARAHASRLSDCSIAPGAQNAILRHRGDPSAAHSDKPPAQESADRGLHGSLRQPRGFGERAVTEPRGGASASVRLPPQAQVHQKRRRRTIMSDQVAHEAVEHVGINADFGHPAIVAIAIASAAADSHTGC